MSTLLPATAAAMPMLTGWTAHTLWLCRRLRQARRDPLTGLDTRAVFERRAGRLLRRGLCAVLVVDLDGFKVVNDRYGHAAGDEVIRDVAASLNDALDGNALDGNRGGIAARLGGDEFAVVVPLRSEIGLPWLLRGLHSEITAPLLVDGRELTVGASIGACWTGDAPELDLSAALRRADEAMYITKRDGGGWLTAAPDAPALATVNGRRVGRDGAHLTPKGGAA
ncbi:GGDEF domain-containing protein [Streptomyces sp. NPDC004134]|uniref:GGDEF domain-containing protein n=1 Tax=Streptomyces sp. NPDC004134 TaxID=3364691 RepID=UPI0036B69976